MLRTMFAVVLAGACLACRTEDVDLRVRVVIPAEISPIAAGELRMTLWAYDPQIADASASPVDAQTWSFSHEMGREDVTWMRVHGDVPAGARTYLTVRGFERTPDGERYILWDGNDSLGTPTLVVMKPVFAPGSTSP